MGIMKKALRCIFYTLLLFSALILSTHCGSKSKTSALEESKETVDTSRTSTSATSSTPSTHSTASSSNATTNELGVAQKSREELIDKSPPPPKQAKPQKPVDITPQEDCAPEFVRLSEPGKSPFLYQVKKYKPEQYTCWAALEEFAIELCEDRQPCTVFYVESSTIKSTTDVAALKKQGIGRFEYKDNWWELRGARIWERAGKGYDYYNSSRY